jgi:Ca2+-binding RTX toxin-like protein
MIFISGKASRRPLMRRVIPLVTSALAVTAAGLVEPATAAAVTCDGQTATIVATANGQDITGTDGPDVISSAGFVGVTVQAGGGDDLVCVDGGGPGIALGDEVHGGPGEDTLIASSARSKFYRAQLLGEEGNDVFRVESGPALLRPGPGDDVINVPSTPTLRYDRPTIWMAFAFDVPAVQIDVGAGTVDGEGHDTFTGVLGFEGTRGADVFTGSAGADFFFDSEGEGSDDPATDIVRGHGGDDGLDAYHSIVDGGAGDDLLRSGHGVIHGGTGRDHIALDAGGDAHGEAGADVFTTTIDYEDALTLPASRFLLDGGAGPDKVFVTSPSDEFGYGRCGHAVCRFLADGGRGADVLSFRDTAGQVHLDLAAGTARYVGGHATVRHFEKVEGSKKSDVLRGTGHADHLDGNAGDDRLVGSGGPDILHGAKGQDVADGGPGRDTCVAEIRRSC